MAHPRPATWTLGALFALTLIQGDVGASAVAEAVRPPAGTLLFSSRTQPPEPLGMVVGVPAAVAGVADHGLAAARFTAGPAMRTARMGHMAVSSSGGGLWVLGGHNSTFSPLSSAEFWSPESNRWTTLAMKYPHDGGTVVMLASGYTLIAGGFAGARGVGAIDGAEIKNPTNHAFSATAGRMTRPRAYATGSTLVSGRTLIVGGWYDAQSSAYGERFDESTGRFAATGPLTTPRALPLVFPTSDGNAVVIGGYDTYGRSMVESVEEYVAASNSFRPLQGSLFPGEAGWQTVAWPPRITAAEAAADGRFVYLAKRPGSGGTTYSLFTFDPRTKRIARFVTSAPLPPSEPPVLDWAFGKAYLLSHGSGNALRLTTVDMRSGALSTDPTVFTPGYTVVGSGFEALTDGRLMLTGGSSSGDNFGAVANTVFISAGSATASRQLLLPLVHQSHPQPTATLVGDVAGKVTDAVTGRVIVGVGVCVDGTTRCTTSDNRGDYALHDLAIGVYTLRAAMAGYVAVTQKVTILPRQTLIQNIALSPNLAEGVMRLVLTWGAQPTDIDALLWLPESHKYLVFYNQPGNCLADLFACLDLDDRDGYGPETITIRKRFTGTYVYAVRNYSQEAPLTTSGAYVRVYDASGMIADFGVPVSGSGRFWYLCDLDGTSGRFTWKNVITDQPPGPY